MTVRSVKPREADSRSYSSSRIAPSPSDSSTIEATSSRVNAEATSSLGSTRISRSTPLAMALSSTTTGRSTCTMNHIGGPSTTAARSGLAIAMFFGTISPSTTCR